MISLIAAVSPSGTLSVNGEIPWEKPVDMRRFRSLTWGNTVIMGRKTWESLGCKLLPSRYNVVLSRSASVLPSHTNPYVVDSIQKALILFPHQESWIIGGSEVYELALPLVDYIDITVVTDYVEPSEAKVTKFSSFLKGFPGFTLVEQIQNPLDPTLEHRKYLK